MGNIPSQQRYIYEHEGAHIAMQLLQNPEVQHVVKSLGDFFRHHGDYIQHRRRRGRKKDKQDREEWLLQQGQRRSDAERSRRRDSCSGEEGTSLLDDWYYGRREGGGRRQYPSNNNFRDPFSNDYHQLCNPRCNRHCPQNPKAPPGPANRPPHGNHRGSRNGHTRRRPPRLVDNEDSSDERFTTAVSRQPGYSRRNPAPGAAQVPSHDRRDRTSGMPPQAPPGGGSRSGRPYPYGEDRQGPPTAGQERRQRRSRGRDLDNEAPRVPGGWDEGPGDERGSGVPDYLPDRPN